jgi:sortase (surface protein transpeptidase)
MVLKSIKKTIKIFWKYFVILFFISFVLTNWSDIGWVFNYRVASEIINQGVVFQPSSQLENEKNGEPIKETEEKVIKNNIIEIAKLGISVPIIFFNNPNESEDIIYAALDQGAVHFPSSVLPGEFGRTIILGHSAPEGWPMIKHDWIFSEINDLTAGDKITIFYLGKEYVYYFEGKVFLDRGEELPKDPVDRNVLSLISCWPPGKDSRRIVVTASLTNN